MLSLNGKDCSAHMLVFAFTKVYGVHHIEVLDEQLSHTMCDLNSSGQIPEVVLSMEHILCPCTV